MKRIVLLIALCLVLATPAFAQQDILKSSTGYPFFFLMVDSSDHITGKTGLSPTVTISKSGASFASPSGSVTEISSGWYKVAGNATDTNTDGPILLHATGSGADPTDAVVGVVVDWNPRSVPTVADVVAAIGPVKTVKKGEAFTNFPIWMLSNSGAAVTGLSTSQITCKASIDGGAFANLADTTETEVGLGKYVVDLSSSETNGNSVGIICTATGAQPYRTNLTPQR
jgi:hypothetical protein